MKALFSVFKTIGVSEVYLPDVLSYLKDVRSGDVRKRPGPSEDLK